MVSVPNKRCTFAGIGLQHFILNEPKVNKKNHTLFHLIDINMATCNLGNEQGSPVLPSTNLTNVKRGSSCARGNIITLYSGFGFR